MNVTREQLAENYPDLVFYASFDEALIGIAHRSCTEPVAVYDRAKVIQILMRDMSHDEAEEYFQFNVIGAWLGELTPIFVELATVIRRETVLVSDTLRRIDSYLKDV